MKEIRNILICGLGAIGGFYAAKIYDNPKYNLRVLIDINRLQRYMDSPRNINGKNYVFDYVLPDDKSYKADLIIISTKSSGLEWGISNIRNFVKDDSIILSFLNGISSEKEIAKVYGEDKVLYSFLLGHTFFREGNNVIHDGCADVYFGYPDNRNAERIRLLSKCFDDLRISYKLPDDILNSQWNKFCFNCCANQISAITGKTFSEMLKSEDCMQMIKGVAGEISQIAKAEGIAGSESFYENVIKSFKLMLPDGKTSMLQDIEAGRSPETDIFGKVVLELGNKYGIGVPVNKKIYEMIMKKI